MMNKEICPSCDGEGYRPNVDEPGYDACYTCRTTGYVKFKTPPEADPVDPYANNND